MEKPIEALSQSFLRTKARTLIEYRKVMELHANSSNNTVYADADGHIAYFHPQFIPKRDDRFDWTRPVDGSDPATEWHGVHDIEDSPHVVDPPGGWIQNTNDWPYSAAGADSPKREGFPRYMDAVGESPRGLHAIRVLEGRKDFTLDRLRDAAFDSYLTAFAQLVPALLAAYDSTSRGNSLKAKPRRADRGAPRVGLPVGGGVGADLARGILGRGAHGPRAGARECGRPGGLQLHGGGHDGGTEIGRARRGGRPTHTRLRDLADAVGGDQPIPAAHRGHRAAVQRSGTKHPGAVHLGALGFARVLRSADISGDEADVWDQREQFRRGGGVRKRQRPGASDDSGRRERRSGVEALRGPGERYAAGDLREVYFYPGQLEGHTERVYHPSAGRP